MHRWQQCQSLLFEKVNIIPHEDTCNLSQVLLLELLFLISVC